MAASQNRRRAKFGRYMQDIRLRQDPAMIPQQVADLAFCRRETVTRLENGTKLPSGVLLGSLLNIYGVTDDERAKAIRLRDYASQGTTMIEHAADLPTQYLAFRQDESDATTERTVDHVVVPGLLQTAGYAAGLAEAGQRLSRGVGWEQRAADERQSRQKLLRGPAPLRLHAMIGEAVLHTTVGGVEVMIEQLQHLLSIGEHENVTIQVVPARAGAWGTMTGSAIILGFDDPDDGGSVYLDYAAGGQTLDNRRDVEAFIGLFVDAAAVALSPEGTAEMIKTVRRALESQ